MKLSTITKKIFTKKTSDYTFTIMFFVIFSLFIAFAIKPSLSTAASLKKEELDLTSVDNLYEGYIMNIANVQSQMEEHRNELPFLKQAISDHPQVNKLIDDIKTIGDKNSFSITKANIDDVNLLNTNSKTLQKLTITVEGTSTFDNLMKYIQDMFNQRRLKTIQRITIQNNKGDATATVSGQLKVTLQVEAYYL